MRVISTYVYDEIIILPTYIILLNSKLLRDQLQILKKKYFTKTPKKFIENIFMTISDYCQIVLDDQDQFSNQCL